MKLANVETRDIILSRQRMRRLICAFVVRIWKSRFDEAGTLLSDFGNVQIFTDIDKFSADIGPFIKSNLKKYPVLMIKYFNVQTMTRIFTLHI